MFEIHPIRAFSDNYIWTLVKDNEVTVVDPGDPKPVKQFLEEKDLTLKNILITHHHFDHTGGIEDLINLSNCEVYGPHGDHIKGIKVTLNEGDEIEISNVKFNVFSTPGHTLDHLSYFANLEEPILFCGDTLFAGGCGRVFEGTYEQMFNSLKKLSNLPANTKVYCGHEYTLSNLKFALEVDIQNKYLIDEYKHILELSKSSTPSLPTTIDKEFKVNPFLRCNDPLIKNKIKKEFGIEGDELETFAALRKWKDNF